MAPWNSGILHEISISCELFKGDLLRTAQAADIAGIRCLLVHAKDDAARQWYESWEFEPSPTDLYHLFLMLKDLKSLLS